MRRATSSELLQNLLGVVDDGTDTAEIIRNSYLLEGNLSGKLAGFQINWSEMEKWQKGHPNAPPEGATGISSVNVRAMCWHGGPKERPQDLSEVVNLTASPSQGDTTYVVGELPYRSNQPSKVESYTCVWGMTQRVDVLKARPLPVSTTQLFHDGEEGAGNDGIGYITEGTNDQTKGWILTEGSTIRPSSDMQTWLSGKEAQEYSSELWPNFRRTDDEQLNRNPWLNCVQKDRCAVAGN